MNVSENVFSSLVRRTDISEFRNFESLYLGMVYLDGDTKAILKCCILWGTGKAAGAYAHCIPSILPPIRAKRKNKCQHEIYPTPWGLSTKL